MASHNQTVIIQHLKTFYLSMKHALVWWKTSKLENYYKRGQMNLVGANNAIVFASKISLSNWKRWLCSVCVVFSRSLLSFIHRWKLFPTWEQLQLAKNCKITEKINCIAQKESNLQRSQNAKSEITCQNLRWRVPGNCNKQKNKTKS